MQKLVPLDALCKHGTSMKKVESKNYLLSSLGRIWWKDFYGSCISHLGGLKGRRLSCFRQSLPFPENFQEHHAIQRGPHASHSPDHCAPHPGRAMALGLVACSPTAQLKLINTQNNNNNNRTHTHTHTQHNTHPFRPPAPDIHIRTHAHMPSDC